MRQADALRPLVRRLLEGVVGYGAPGDHEAVRVLRNPDSLRPLVLDLLLPAEGGGSAAGSEIVRPLSTAPAGMGGRILNRQLGLLLATSDRNRRVSLAWEVQADIDSLAKSNRRCQVILARLVELGVVSIPMDDDEPIELLIAPEEGH